VKQFKTLERKRSSVFFYSLTKDFKKEPLEKHQGEQCKRMLNDDEKDHTAFM
jgi:hypothetical protein